LARRVVLSTLRFITLPLFSFVRSVPFGHRTAWLLSGVVLSSHVSLVVSLYSWQLLASFPQWGSLIFSPILSCPLVCYRGPSTTAPAFLFVNFLALFLLLHLVEFHILPNKSPVGKRLICVFVLLRLPPRPIGG